MNREIKFRAWDDGRIFYSHNNSLNDSNFQNKWFFEKVREDAVIMQFTGLTDKNGKDIYFDDLYKDEDGDVFKVIQMDCGRYALQMVSNGYVDEFIDWSEVEIIGNLFETPELLTENK